MGPLVVLRVALPDDALARLKAAYPEARVVTCEGDGGLEDVLADVEVLIGGVELAPDVARAAPRLRWVQTSSVGAEGFLDLAAQFPSIEG